MFSLIALIQLVSGFSDTIADGRIESPWCHYVFQDLRVSDSGQIEGVLNQESAIRDYFSSGKLKSEIRVSNGTVTERRYDENERLVSSIYTDTNFTQSQNQRKTGMGTFEYDHNGNIIREENRSSDGSIESLISYKYDSLGRLIEKNKLYSENGKKYSDTTVITYTASGREETANQLVPRDSDKKFPYIKMMSTFDKIGRLLAREGQRIKSDSDVDTFMSSTIEYDDSSTAIHSEKQTHMRKYNTSGQTPRITELFYNQKHKLVEKRVREAEILTLDEKYSYAEKLDDQSRVILSTVLTYSTIDSPDKLDRYGETSFQYGPKGLISSSHKVFSGEGGILKSETEVVFNYCD